MRLVLALLAALPLPAHADVLLDDSDLSGRPAPAQAERLEREARHEDGAFAFPLSGGVLRQDVGARQVTGTLLLADRAGNPRPARLARVSLDGASWIPVDDTGRFALPAPAEGGAVVLRASLDNRYWSFRSAQDKPYEWRSQAALPPEGGLDLGELKPDPASENGKLGILHLTYLDALDLLSREAELSWWKSSLTVRWPGSADFFMPGAWSLELTNALAWDVVLHELGHAVMNGAMRASPAGGQHKIDECYSEALAWSEGWATFFAGAVRLSRGDPDAKFEFLVPRRSPIRLENVPEDVCRGSKNEWRVAAGLWDLYDENKDGSDQYAMPFTPIWRALAGARMGSLPEAWALIGKNLSVLERAAGDEALRQNTLLPPRPALAFKAPALPWAETR